MAMVLVGAAPSAASARDGGGDEVRARGTCGGGVRSELRLKAQDGGIATELRVDHARRDSAWRVTVVQEGRVVWRGHARARGGSGAFRLQRRLRDLAGADRVGGLASGAGGATCRGAATLAGGGGGGRAGGGAGPQEP